MTDHEDRYRKAHDALDAVSREFVFAEFGPWWKNDAAYDEETDARVVFAIGEAQRAVEHAEQRRRAKLAQRAEDRRRRDDLYREVQQVDPWPTDQAHDGTSLHDVEAILRDAGGRS